MLFSEQTAYTHTHTPFTINTDLNLLLDLSTFTYQLVVYYDNENSDKKCFFTRPLYFNCLTFQYIGKVYPCLYTKNIHIKVPTHHILTHIFFLKIMRKQIRIKLTRKMQILYKVQRHKNPVQFFLCPRHCNLVW